MKEKAVSIFLQERIDAGDFPSAVYLVAEKGEIVLRDALGFAVVEPERIVAGLDTIYDLASLTKVLATGLMAAQHLEDGDLELDSTVAEHIPAVGNSAAGDLTIRQLITHSSGLPAWRPIYLLARSSTPADVAGVIADLKLSRVGTAVEYSDLNFIILALVITGARPDLEFDREVVKRLGLINTGFNPVSRALDRMKIAASEKGNEYERQICIEQGYLDVKNPAAAAGGSDGFRHDVIWGEVHDGNAYFMGGVAGHAGLFSTADEVFKIAQQFLPNYTKLLNPKTCELFRTNFTPGMNEDRSFAFQLASTKDSTSGTKMSPQSFGHNGFTGTSLWIDPVKDRVCVLLTNRTHNHGLPLVNINSVRRRFHDLAIDFLDKDL